jgi:glycosyltransferase involved in cell wall biosynthesis
MKLSNKLTIVIPCKNEGRGILDTLESLNTFTGRIIVADSSTDNTRELIKAFDPTIEIVDGGLPAIARNIGANLRNTKFILFLDADIVVDSTLIETAIHTMEQESLDLLTCKITVPELKYKFLYWFFNPIQKGLSKIAPLAIGGFMLFRRSTFNKLEGFCEQDKLAEDFHLSIKIQPKRFKILNRTVLTTSRRFKNKGVTYMIKLAILSWLNRNNPEFYKNDRGYWKK